MLNSGSTGRGQGVRVPTEGGPIMQNTVQRVTSLVPLDFFACQYVDQNGKQHHQLVAYDGHDTVYFIGSEEEARKLKQAASWIVDQVKQRVGSRRRGDAAEPLPKEDAVDVLQDPSK